FSVGAMENGGGRGKRPCPTTPPTATRAAEADGQEEAVEKFYVLLENIRAMRDLIRTNDSYKRQKTEATPPWRPTFALEDFREKEEACATAESALNPSKEEGRRKGKEKEKREVGEEEDSVDLSLSL
ncbi:hypothetical protein BHE74_00007905, partial [Ensete ventricosum]